MSMVEKVKTALRIQHNFLDADITDTINTARAEMIRAGVKREIAQGDSDLIQMAIKTYCLYIYASDQKKADGYYISWAFQLDNLRKSKLEN